MENYSKLLEKAKEAYKNCATDAEKRRLESIFPELKENEDEKIAKELIRYLPYCDDISKDTKERWIAWLEKQGKQGEILETNNFEPKFKVGDWIFRDGFHPARIVDKAGDKYEIEFTDDGFKGLFQIGFIDKHCRLWTIEDAKDGDILTYRLDDGRILTFIYEGLGTSYEGQVDIHAILDRDYFSETSACVCCEIMELLTPATKEQRDRLFQKMKEAGYEWDDENKELRGRK